MKKNIILIIVLALIGVSIWYLETSKEKVDAPVIEVNRTNETVEGQDTKDRLAFKSKNFTSAKEITTPDHFINTEPFTIKDLIGKKVILVDFWTYSCINCQRTLPFLRAWHEKYADKGLVIVGLHTPEFEFEKEVENVEDAVKSFEIKYPVVMDNDFSTWTAYKNRYWPRKYLIDIDGFVVYDHIGEGGYEETEKKIQELLEERMTVLGEEGDVPKEVTKADNAGPKGVNSPEVYFGAWRNGLLANGRAELEGEQNLVLGDEIEKNALYLDGNWLFSREFAETNTEKAKIVFKYEAQNVFFVGSADSEVKVKILRDGQPVGDAAGADVDSDGFVTVNKERLYSIIEDEGNPGEHLLEMIVEGEGLKMFTFTFG